MLLLRYGIILFITLVYNQISQAQLSDHWETAIFSNDTWRYFVGNSEPNPFWRAIEFDDSRWPEGKGGIGYGDGDDSTVIGTCSALYLRKVFMVSDTAALTAAVISIDYDDAFVAYINGIEIARSGIDGAYPPYTTAGRDHEAKMYAGGLPEDFSISKNLLSKCIINGANVFSVQVHNASTSSSDLTAIPFLSFGIKNEKRYFRPSPPWFKAPGVTTVFTSTLPILDIRTINGQQILNNGTKITAIMRVIDGTSSVNKINDSAANYGYIGIEIRGSTSAAYPQKPYSIETRNEKGNNRKTALLGMPPENDWVLISNYNDKTLLRNSFSHQLFRTMGHYGSRTKHCEVLINDEYQGIYVLAEKIKRDTYRVDIAKPDPEAMVGDRLTGGYILKNDNRDADEDFFYSNYSEQGLPNNAQVAFIYHTPETKDITPAQKQYIAAYIKSFEDALYGPQFMHSTLGYKSFIDETSFIDYFLIGEVSRSVDAYKKSKYYYKERDSRGGKLFSGPTWDFDWAYKNIPEGDARFECYYGNTDGSGWAYKVLFCNHFPRFPGWANRLMQDPAFQNKVKTRYTDLRKTILSLGAVNKYIDSMGMVLNEAQTRHYKKWNILGVNSTGSPEVDVQPATYGAALIQLKNWIKIRLEWLDKNLPGQYISTPIAESINQHGVKIFPNPAQDILFIEATTKIKKIELYTLSGKQIQTITTNDFTNKLNIYSLKDGMYILKSYFPDGSMRSSKIAVTK